MRAKSASTLISDPYRAGMALGEELRALSPEVVFLFSTVHYGETTELLDGLYDTLERDDMLVVGCSGDGFYESQRASDFGVAALGLNSGGAVRWALSRTTGVGAAPEATLRAGLEQLGEALGGERPALIFMLSDFRTDASRLEQVLRRETDVPIVGGLAADDYSMAGCFLFANRQLVQDGLVLLGACGPLAFDISIGHALQPIGRVGRVDAAEQTDIRSIDGLSAMDFIERETGKPVLQTDRGVLTLSILDPEHPEFRRLRSIVPDFGKAEGALGLYGGVETGNLVQVCLAHPDELLGEVHALAARSRTLTFEPVAAVIVSCGGRKQILGDAIGVEVEALARAHSDGLAIAGFPSFGEIGPLKDGAGYGPNLFHNMTYVLLLIGTSP